MTPTTDRFERLLRWYPVSWRQANGEVLLGTLRDQAEHEQREEPTFRETLSAVVNGLGQRLDARFALLAALAALVLGTGSWVFFLFAMDGLQGAAGWIGIVTVGVAPALTLAGLVALLRSAGLIAPPRALTVLVVLLCALAFAVLAQFSWAEGFRLADEGLPTTGLAAAFVPLFAAGLMLGVSGIALFVDDLFHRTPLRWFARVPLALLAGGAIAPVIGVGLISPTATMVVAAAVCVFALTRLGRGVAYRPRITRPDTDRRLSAVATRNVVITFALLSAVIGVVGFAYALTGASWSVATGGATDTMRHGIATLLAAGILLLPAIGLRSSIRHGRAAVWGPIGLAMLALIVLAIAYLFGTPAWEDMVWGMIGSAILGGSAVTWWSTPRLRGPFGPRMAVGAAIGAGYAALISFTVPMLAFAVPALAGVIAFRARKRPAATNTRAAQEDVYPVSAT